VSDPANDEEESNVVEWNGVTRLPIDPDRVLKKAVGRLQEVVVLGYDHEGNEYFASSKPDGPSIVWLIERAKLKLLTIMTDNEIE
jgi:hypothetical protein